jgi:hypothetical protein
MTDEEKAKEAAWIVGRLYLFLNPSQRKIYDAFKISINKNSKFVVNCSRKIGKSVLGLFLGAETCIGNKNALVAFIAPTVDDVQEYVRQLYQTVFATCPEHLKPKLQRTQLVFPNGSKILFRGVGKGVGTSYNNLRSFAFDLIILDEAGFSANLDEIVDGALVSTLIPRNGNMLLLSTPPVTPDHAFKGYCDQAEIDGAYMKLTIRDSHYSLERQEKFIKDLGGLTSHKVRREFFCEFVIDTDFQLCPEWKPEYEREMPKGDNFKLWFKYDALDQGWSDNSVCGFATVEWMPDFEHNSYKSVLVLRDEVCMKSPEQTTDLLAERIIAKELEVFGISELFASPVKKRIADNNTPSLLQDFNLRHHLYFSPVESKTYLDVMVSDVRELVKAGRVYVSPKCVQVLGCLKNGVWTKTKGGTRGKEFSRSKTYGHYDGFAMLMYLIRSVDMLTNPLPPEYRANLEHTFVPRKMLEGDKAQIREIISAGLDEAMNQEFNQREHNESYD